MRLVLADDHPVVLRGLATLFAHEPDIEVVAECRNGDEAVEAVKQHRPDVLLVDLRMPGRSGLGVVRELVRQGSEVRVVLMASELNHDDAVEALKLGVQGVVLKDLAPRLLVQCVRKVHGGERWIERQSLGGVLDAMVGDRLGRLDQSRGLSEREREVIQLVAEGMRNREIAAKLRITEGTVKIHLHHVYKKLGVGSRLELMMRVRSKGT
jgi:DNA-binding NarL/FixJ family response regulator